MIERNEVTTNEKVPALVVSGFLGSGKTTLIRSLLDQAVADGVRVALISNEIGELGVDRALLGEGGKAYVELEGGCVCCELADDLVDTLQALRDEINPDRIVVETSGAALPFDTQLNFWRDPVRDWVGDDMAVVVVNAEQLVEGRDEFFDEVGVRPERDDIVTGRRLWPCTHRIDLGRVDLACAMAQAKTKEVDEGLRESALVRLKLDFVLFRLLQEDDAEDHTRWRAPGQGPAGQMRTLSPVLAGLRNPEVPAAFLVSLLARRPADLEIPAPPGAA